MSSTAKNSLNRTPPAIGVLRVHPVSTPKDAASPDDANGHGNGRQPIDEETTTTGGGMLADRGSR